MSDLQKKNTTDLLNYLGEKREELRGLRFGGAGSGVRNTQAQKLVKKEIARILTEVSVRKRTVAKV